MLLVLDQTFAWQWWWPKNVLATISALSLLFFSFYRVTSQPVGLSVLIRSLLQSHLLCSLLLVAPIFWNLVEPRLEPSCLLVSAGIHKISEPSGTKLGTKLFASLCWESPTFGTKWNQVEPRLEPSCLLVSAGNLMCIPGLLNIIII